MLQGAKLGGVPWGIVLGDAIVEGAKVDGAVLEGILLEGAGGDGGGVDLWSAQGTCQAEVSLDQAGNKWQVT